jgi:hypothetical protein
MGPGGVAITTPPQSQLVFNPFGDIPKSGSIGAGGGICTFALELFFIIAFFLFLMFLPIVVFAFQLWWMLALRFCIPPSIGFSITADFLADASVSVDLALDIRADAQLKIDLDNTDLVVDGHPTPDEVIDQIFGTDSTILADQGVWLDAFAAAKDAGGNSIFNTDPAMLTAAVASTDPDDAVQPEAPELEEVPPDPLCS